MGNHLLDLTCRHCGSLWDNHICNFIYRFARFQQPPDQIDAVRIQRSSFPTRVHQRPQLSTEGYFDHVRLDSVPERFISFGCCSFERKAIDLVVWKEGISEEESEMIIQFFLGNMTLVVVFQRNGEKCCDKLYVNGIDNTESAPINEDILSNDIDLEIIFELARPFAKQLSCAPDIEVPNLFQAFWNVIVKYLF